MPAQRKLTSSLRAGNPLFEPLVETTEFDRWKPRLHHRPLANYDIAAMSAAEREVLLDGLAEQHFVVTPRAVTVCSDMQRTVLGGLVARNPTHAHVRRQQELIRALVREQIKLSELPWFPSSARGMLISGELGTQKSTIVKRFLQTLGPISYCHSASPAAGWMKFTQLCWLYLQLSTDGSRGGLLDEILVAMDAALGTDYSRQYARLPIHAKLVRVAERLSAHLCGVLVVDELQLENFLSSPWHGVFCLFFLRLLNFGIPVILIGNPMAFSEIRQHAQVLSRLTSGGDHRLRPFACATDKDFVDTFMPGMWELNVLRGPTELNARYCELHFAGSGGISRYIAWIRCRSQGLAMHDGKEALTEEYVHKAIATFSDEVKRQGQGFAQRKPGLLSGFTDLPYSEYLGGWHANPAASPPPPMKPETSGSDAKGTPARAKASNSGGQSPSRKLRAKFKTDKTKEERRAERASRVSSTLSGDDMRGPGSATFHLGALDQLLKKLQPSEQGVGAKEGQ